MPSHEPASLGECARSDGSQMLQLGVGMGMVVVGMVRMGMVMVMVIVGMVRMRMVGRMVWDSGRLQ